MSEPHADDLETRAVDRGRVTFGLVTFGVGPVDIDGGVIDTLSDTGVVAADTVVCDATCVATETPQECNDQDTSTLVCEEESS